MRLGEVMTQPVVTVPRDTPLATCAVTLAAGRMRHLPVVDEAGRCVGILTDFEIRPRGRVVEGIWVWREDADRSLVASQVARELEVVRLADDDLVDALDALAESSQDLILATDLAGRPVGILTEHDVVRLAAARSGGVPLPPARRALPLVESTTPALDARSLLARRREPHGLVVKDGVLVGVLSLRDVALEDSLSDTVTAGEVCSTPLSVRQDAGWDAARVAALLHERKIGCLPVVDDEGRPVGLVSRRSLVVGLASALRRR
jgi:CBS domain-containing protein